jgi:hypothetical protein
MERAERNRRERLDSILARYDGEEARAKADLLALYGFKTIRAARLYQARLRSLDRIQAGLLAARA